MSFFLYFVCVIFIVSAAGEKESFEGEKIIKGKACNLINGMACYVLVPLPHLQSIHDLRAGTGIWIRHGLTGICYTHLARVGY